MHSTGAPPVSPELERGFEQHRAELNAYSYRMLGSAFEAEDAVQETFIRAWRGFDALRGSRGAALVALPDRDERLPRHARRPEAPRARRWISGRRGTPTGPLGGTLPEVTWIEPIPDALVVPAEADPAEVAVARETIRLAFVAALQHLPPRQRAVLILCEVLRWKAAEVAELLETSVASVNSALQRARATLEASDVTLADASPSVDDARTRSCSRATSRPSSATTWTRSRR